MPWTREARGPRGQLTGINVPARGPSYFSRSNPKE